MARSEYSPQTPDGTPLNEAVSAMIKELRRGKEAEGLYWAKQIEVRFYKYVWKRLMIFAAEDVSIANPDAIVQVRALHEAYMFTRDSKVGGDACMCPHCGEVVEAQPAQARADKDVLALAVMILARSPKCRESNLLWAAVDELEKVGWKPEVPDYALDGHTRRGKMIHPIPEKRHLLWFTEWSKVVPDVGPSDLHAWHVRRMVAQKIMTEEQAQQILLDYVERDVLVYKDELPFPEWEDQARR